jgi:hypothetical protein
MYLPIRRGLLFLLRLEGFTSILGMLKTGSKEHFQCDEVRWVTVAYDRGNWPHWEECLEGSRMDCAHGICRMDVGH